MQAKKLIGGAIGSVIGISMYPVISETIASVNATGVNGLLLSLTGTVFLAGLVYGVVNALIK